MRLKRPSAISHQKVPARMLLQLGDFLSLEDGWCDAASLCCVPDEKRKTWIPIVFYIPK